MSGVSIAAAQLTPVEEPAHTASLDRALVQGIAWTGLLKWGSQVIAWAATLIVARTLAPADYGLYAMATMFLNLVALLSEFGIGTAVVTLRNLADEQVAQINGLALVFGISAFAVSCASALPLGRFFDSSELPPVVFVLSLGFLVTAVRVVPYALLQKELRFKWIAFVDGVQAIVSAASAVVLALAGFEYWALVLGGLLGIVVATILVLASRRQRIALPRLQSLRQAIGFSWHMVVSRLAFYLYSAADLLVVGKTLGSSALGAYSLASTLAFMMPDKLSALLANVTPSILSTVQHQSAALRRYLLSLTEGMAVMVFPATLGLAAVAEDFVPLVLGEKWRSMIAPLQALAIYVGFRAIAPLPVHVLIAIGQTRFMMRSQVVTALVLPVAFYIGSYWGTVGVAAAWAVVHPVVNLVICRRTFRHIGLSAREYMAALSPALVGSLVMLIAVWAVDRMFTRTWPPVLHLASQVVVGVAAYALAIVLFHRDRIRSFQRAWALLRA